MPAVNQQGIKIMKEGLKPMEQAEDLTVEEWEAILRAISDTYLDLEDKVRTDQPAEGFTVLERAVEKIEKIIKIKKAKL